MTKSAKGKKRRKQIVKRLKHKIIHKLQKCKNETKTQFMARKVVLRNQLVERDCTDLVTKKKLEVKDLLNRLEHPSPRFRKDGLIGLKEILATNEAIVVVPVLSSIVTCLGPMFLDLDGNLRGYTIRVIELIFQKMGKYVDPYFHIFVDYISCGLVSLDPEIQGDSLLFMDIFLSYKSYLVARHSQILLKQLVFLISKKVASKSENMPVPLNTMKEEEREVATKKTVKNPDQCIILAQNMNHKLHENKWRVKLLVMMEKYLKAIYAEREKIQTKVPACAWDLIQRGMSPAYLTDPHQGYINVSNTFHPGLDIIRNIDDLRCVIGIIKSSIQQMWNEVSPRVHNKGDMDGVLLTSLAACALHSMLSILTVLHRLVGECVEEDPDIRSWFVKEMKPAISTFMTGFPYDVQLKEVNREEGNVEFPRKEKPKSSSDVSFDKSPDDLNLLMAQIYLEFFPQKIKYIDRFLSFALSYYDVALRAPETCRLSKLSTYSVLLLNCYPLQRDQQGFRDLLKKAFLLYQKLSSECIRERFLLLPVLTRSIGLDCLPLIKSGIPESWYEFLERELFISSSLTMDHLKTGISLKMKLGLTSKKCLAEMTNEGNTATRFNSHDKQEAERLWKVWLQLIK